MRKCSGLLVCFLLLLSAATAFCQNKSGQATITEEEYEIYRLVIAKLAGRCAVDSETLAGVRIDPGKMSARGIQADKDIMEDFNVKNIKAYKLAAAFVSAMASGSEDSLEGRKKVTFTRIGFNREKQRALLIMGMTLYYAEDIMNEGTYVILEKENGRWTIGSTVSAWEMRLGLIR